MLHRKKIKASCWKENFDTSLNFTNHEFINALKTTLVKGMEALI